MHNAVELPDWPLGGDTNTESERPREKLEKNKTILNLLKRNPLIYSALMSVRSVLQLNKVICRTEAKNVTHAPYLVLGNIENFATRI